MSKPDVKVIVPYVQNSNIAPNLVTGAFGGISPVGQQLLIQFYVERPQLPDHEELLIDPDTLAVKSHKQVPQNVAHEKLVVFSAAMPEDSVRMLRDWLSGKLKEFEMLRSEGKII